MAWLIDTVICRVSGHDWKPRAYRFDGVTIRRFSHCERCGRISHYR